MLREAEHRLGEGDLESSCEVALAHVRAGHSARAEQLACELCRVHRDEPLAWLTLARLLHQTGRYRDAAGPALRAVDLGVTGAAAKVLLARIFARMGPDGRARGGAVALGLIEAHPTEAPLEREELADLVRIAEDGGAPLWACRRGDDHVSSLGPDADAPPEWLGEAAARRCHGVWGPDAPAWLARLAAPRARRLLRRRPLPGANRPPAAQSRLPHEPRHLHRSPQGALRLPPPSPPALRSAAPGRRAPAHQPAQTLSPTLLRPLGAWLHHRANVPARPAGQSELPVCFAYPSKRLRYPPP